MTPQLLFEIDSETDINESFSFHEPIKHSKLRAKPKIVSFSPTNLEFEYNQLLAHLENLTTCLCPECEKKNQIIEEAIYASIPKY